MQKYRITAPDGKVYNITGENRDGALNALQSYLGDQSGQASPVESRSPEYDEALSDLSQMSRDPASAIENERIRYNREQYDNMPTLGKIGTAAYDVANLIGDGATFGFGDKISAGVRSALTDETYEEALKSFRQDTQASRDRAGTAGTAANIVGAVGTGVGLASRGATLAGRLGTGTMAGGKGVAARAALAVPEGAAYGMADALGHDTDVSKGALYGAIGGAGGSIAADTLTGLVRGVSSAVRGKGNIPSTDALKRSAADAYAAAENAGVIYSPNAVERLKQRIVPELAEFGYRPDLHSGAKNALDVINELSGKNTTLKGLEQARKAIRGGYKGPLSDFSKENNAAVSKILDAFDDMVTRPGSKDIVMGNQVEGLQSLLKAREMWLQTSKAQALEDALARAELRASSTGTGGNIENASRQEVRKLLTKGKGYTADEKKVMTEIVTGSPGQNLLRLVGKLSPQGNGLMMMLQGVGGYATGGASLPLAGAGITSKWFADKGVQKGISGLSELIRSGGTQQSLEAAKGTLKSLTSNQRLAIARIFMLAGAQTGSQ